MSPTIALIGPFGYGNLGDAATQESVLKWLAAHRPDAEVVAVSLLPKDTQARHGLRAFPIRRQEYGAAMESGPTTPGLWGRVWGKVAWRLRGVRQLLLEARHGIAALRFLGPVDTLVFSGGGQLDEAWGGPWEHPWAMMKWALLARLSGAEVAMLSVGVGSADHPVSKVLLNAALRLSNRVSFRDTGSLALAREKLGYKGPASVNPDLAFALLSGVSEPSAVAQPAVVGVGPIPYCSTRDYVWPEADSRRYAIYIRRMVELVERMVSSGAMVRFVVGEVHHDRQVIEDLLGELRARSGPLDAIMWTPIESVDDLVAELAQTDVVVTSRFHGALLSLSLGRPVVALSYERKIGQLMKEFGMSDACFGIEDFDPAEVAASVDELLRERRVLAEELIKPSAAARAAVLEQFDTTFGRLPGEIWAESPRRVERATLA